jgi:hypothetical protein
MDSKAHQIYGPEGAGDFMSNFPWNESLEDMGIKQPMPHASNHDYSISQQTCSGGVGQVFFLFFL